MSTGDSSYNKNEKYLNEPQRETSGYTDPQQPQENQKHCRSRNGSNVIMGLLLLTVGGILLVKSMGVPIPRWLLSWQMLLIGLGLFIGFTKNFEGGGWIALIIVGLLFQLNEFVLDGNLRRHIWPVVFIIMGTFFIFRSRTGSRWSSTNEFTGRWPPRRYEKKNNITDIDDEGNEIHYNHDDYIDTASVFGGTKKIILSKNFRGGELVNVFGGTEVDLTHADIKGVAKLDVTNIFGGTTLFIPAHWIIRSDATVIFGGINDKKYTGTYQQDFQKTIIIEGVVLFGGIDIKRY